MASNKISYCSLEEAWGEKYANLYKKDDSMVPQMPPNNANADTTILNDRSLNKDMENFYIATKNEMKEKTKCEDVLSHIMECKDCKEKLNKMLNINNNNVEEFSNMNSISNIGNNVVDIAILLLLGVFIIFILDCFVRFGKYFRK